MAGILDETQIKDLQQKRDKDFAYIFHTLDELSSFLDKGNNSLANCLINFDFNWKKLERGNAVPVNLIFEKAYFAGKADFSEATFSGETDFSEATFSGEADFSKVTFSGEADFSKVTFSGETDFIKTTFLGEVNFSKATFSRFANFYSATFSREAHFASTKFLGEARFRETIFSEFANFYRVTFAKEFGVLKKLRITHVKCPVWIDFSEAAFLGKAHFTFANFLGDTYFNDSKFSKTADFSETTFSESIEFLNTRFEAFCDFSGVKFKKDMEFIRTCFMETCNFSGAKFEEKAIFHDAEVVKNMILHKTQFQGGLNLARINFIQGGHLDLVKVRVKSLNSLVYSKVNPNDWKKDLTPRERETSHTLWVFWQRILSAFCRRVLNPLFSNEILTTHETYSILKRQALKQNNKVEASKFHVKEMKVLRLENKSRRNIGDKTLL